MKTASTGKTLKETITTNITKARFKGDTRGRIMGSTRTTLFRIPISRWEDNLGKATWMQATTNTIPSEETPFQEVSST